MSEHRLEEYLDGLLSEKECVEMEAALARDESLREELIRVRKFDTLLAGLHDSSAEERSIRRIVSAAERIERRRSFGFRVTALAAALLVGVGVGWMMRPADPGPDSRPVNVPDGIVLAEWQAFGQRLGEIAAERRSGRVPRLGLSGYMEPPATASGMVFKAALEALDVETTPLRADEAAELVQKHFVAMRGRGRGIEDECWRAAAALRLYRKLRVTAGGDVANAFYDVFQPGVADPETSARVRDTSALGRYVAAQTQKRYASAYEDAVDHLIRRYGADNVALVLDTLAPGDQRRLRHDATREGIVPDAVLSIRAYMYKTACDVGVERLYVAAN